MVYLYAKLWPYHDSRAVVLVIRSKRSIITLKVVYADLVDDPCKYKRDSLQVGHSI